MKNSKKHMQIILLSGGSGKRLWPLSNDVRSKQFIKAFRNEKGELESMVQRVYRQIHQVDEGANVTIATGKKQVSAIRNQLGNKVDICVEPDRRDTFPAICLAAAYLRDKKGVSEDEIVVVCPVDPYVQEGYFEALKELADIAEIGDVNLSLMGIAPTYPSEKYGYIIPENNEKVSLVKTFREKPDAETAKEYIAQGALWNGGVFAFRLGYLLQRAHERILFHGYQDLYDNYAAQKKISFDYAVVEQEKRIQVLRYQGEWKDLGTWNTFTEAMETETVGNVVLDETGRNVQVVNEQHIPVLCMGCRDMVVVAGRDGILVADKEQSSYIKPYVDKMEQQIMHMEKSWGDFNVLDIQEESMTVSLSLSAGHKLHYHSHENRDEVWTVVSGNGISVIDDVENKVKAGDVIKISSGVKHRMLAETEMKLIEVQMGKNIDVKDKQKFD